MEYEWDGRKAASNLAKHGVGFETAMAVFSDATRRTLLDVRRDYGEARLVTPGRVDGRVYVVAYTMRGGVVRIISARIANRREVAAHDAR
ncbi:BrnT family toxin [Salinarimonas rosea]|uniref:BrnT family toxin n=1 Tax=Salinarimonas rosea TaxID=552063 RepID=UPI000407004E|nr:BrnT family toxin [Salinarimonas rosea]